MNGGCWETINDSRHPEKLNESHHYPIISHAINSHSLVLLENIVRLTLQQHLYFCNVGVTVKHWLCVISWRCSQAAVLDLTSRFLAESSQCSRYPSQQGHLIPNTRYRLQMQSNAVHTEFKVLEMPWSFQERTKYTAFKSLFSCIKTS